MNRNKQILYFCIIIIINTIHTYKHHSIIIYYFLFKFMIQYVQKYKKKTIFLKARDNEHTTTTPLPLVK